MKQKTHETNDRAVTIRITSRQFETVTDLAAENRTTVSALIGGFVDSCVEIIEQKDDPDLPRFLAVCRLSHNYEKGKEKLR